MHTQYNIYKPPNEFRIGVDELVDKITELAYMFKNRDNIAPYEVTTATLINKNPITLKLSEKIFLSKEYKNLILTETVYNKIQNVDMSIGIEILVIPIGNGEMWYAIDKVVRL